MRSLIFILLLISSFASQGFAARIPALNKQGLQDIVSSIEKVVATGKQALSSSKRDTLRNIGMVVFATTLICGPMSCGVGDGEGHYGTINGHERTRLTPLDGQYVYFRDTDGTIVINASVMGAVSDTEVLVVIPGKPDRIIAESLIGGTLDRDHPDLGETVFLEAKAVLASDKMEVIKHDSIYVHSMEELREVLATEDLDIDKYLAGAITHAYTDGSAEVTVTGLREAHGNHKSLFPGPKGRGFIIFLIHQDTPPEQGGYSLELTEFLR